MGRGPSIEGRKNAVDAVKAKLFTKLIREIGLAVRAAGADPAGNPRLRLAMSRALDVNMTKDRIEAAIKRASGEGAEAPQEVRYEGYGPGGIAVLVDCVTDNPTRTVAEVRHAFSKNGGNMGTSGSVAFQFSEVGQLWFDLSGDALALVSMRKRRAELAKGEQRMRQRVLGENVFEQRVDLAGKVESLGGILHTCIARAQRTNRGFICARHRLKRAHAQA